MVMDYSRCGSGESGDTLPYDVYREIEDLAALINIVQARAGQAAGSVDAARQVKDLLASATKTTHPVRECTCGLIVCRRWGRLPVQSAPDNAACASLWHRLGESSLEIGQEPD